MLDSLKPIKQYFVNNFRQLSVFLLIIAYFIFLFISLYKIQIRDSEYYKDLGDRQYSGKSQDLARGRIFFSDKDGSKGDLVADTIEVEKEDKSGNILKVENRIYPYDSIGAKVVGFVAYNENDRVGRYGIEKYYNDVLLRDNEKFWTNFFAEIFGNATGTLTSDDPVNEGDIVLTIDGEMEKYLHEVLLDTQKKWKSDTIGGIIMSPKDGRVVAMEELPTFDLNNFNKVDDIKVYKNDLVSGVYEMGSIIKPLTVAAALDAGKINLSSTYYDSGMRVLNGRNIHNYDGRARGTVNVQEILSQSLNVGIVHLVELLGGDGFSDYFKRYGLGSETGIDLPSEASGLTSNLDSKIFVDRATAGFGQGVALTPIQTVRALATLGNGGKLVNPYIVDSIEFKDGSVKKITPDQGEEIFDNKDTSENVTRMLVKVVDTALAKGAYKKDHYSIASKTGTAQMVAPNGKYYEDRYLHSIFAYYPAYDPEYIIFLYHTYPKGAEYASQTLTESLFKLIDFSISYYNIAPDR
ncbi:MAG: hypothetical protein QG614_418 [Patescibacteria group bacterium]|nr:hypothetical protein [Patescibacteria group bacterium]